MNRFKEIFRFAIKMLYAMLLIALMVVVATSGTLIYDFAEPEPFSGPDIFNPYRNMDTTHCWKKANFHTHSRVEQFHVFHSVMNWLGMESPIYNEERNVFEPVE